MHLLFYCGYLHLPLVRLKVHCCNLKREVGEVYVHSSSASKTYSKRLYFEDLHFMRDDDALCNARLKKDSNPQMIFVFFRLFLAWIFPLTPLDYFS